MSSYRRCRGTMPTCTPPHPCLKAIEGVARLESRVKPQPSCQHHLQVDGTRRTDDKAARIIAGLSAALNDSLDEQEAGAVITSNQRDGWLGNLGRCRVIQLPRVLMLFLCRFAAGLSEGNR